MIINKSQDCTVKVFMSCLFDSNYLGLVLNGESYTDEEIQAAWKVIYTEFVDLSDMINTTEFEMMKTIFYLDCRVKRVKLLVFIQNESLRLLGMPCLKAFENIRTYGHKLFWDKDSPDKHGFIRQLIAIENKERRYEVELQEKQKEFFGFKKKQQEGGIPLDQNRKNFIRRINSMKRSGYVIDKNETSSEELALMWKDYDDELQREYNKK